IAPETSETARDSGFGSKTDEWIQGKLAADALSWNDEDAARRAVETRNAAGPAPHRPGPPSVKPGLVVTGVPAGAGISGLSGMSSKDAPILPLGERVMLTPPPPSAGAVSQGPVPHPVPISPRGPT